MGHVPSVARERNPTLATNSKREEEQRMQDFWICCWEWDKRRFRKKIAEQRTGRWVCY